MIVISFVLTGEDSVINGEDLSKLEELKSHLRTRIANYADDLREDKYGPEFVDQITKELSIYLKCDRGKHSILPNKPWLQRRALGPPSKVIFTNYYTIHFNKQTVDMDTLQFVL